MKIKIGDRVRIKDKRLKWYLSDEGQDCFYMSSGKQDEYQSLTHDDCTVAIINMLLDPNITLTVEKHNWPCSNEENFTVRIGRASFNVEPKMLIKCRKTND